MRLGLELGTKHLAFTAVAPVLGGDGVDRTPYNTLEWCEPFVLGYEAAVPLGGRDVVPELLVGKAARERLRAGDAPAKLQEGSLAIWQRPLRDVGGRSDRALAAADALLRGAIRPAAKRLRSAATVFIGIGSEYFASLREAFAVRVGGGALEVSVLPHHIALAGRSCSDVPARRVVVDWGGGALRITSLQCQQVGPRRFFVRVLLDEAFPHLGTAALEARLALELFSNELATPRAWDLAERLESLWFPESSIGAEQTSYVIQSATPVIESFRERACECLRAFGRRADSGSGAGSELFVTGSGAALLDDAHLRALIPAVSRIERPDPACGVSRALASLHARPSTITCLVDGALHLNLAGHAPVTLFEGEELLALDSDGQERWLQLAMETGQDGGVQGALTWGAGIASGNGVLVAEVARDASVAGTKPGRWLGVRCHRSGKLLYGNWMLRDHPSAPGEEHAWSFDSASHREWTYLPATEGVLT